MQDIEPIDWVVLVMNKEMQSAVSSQQSVVGSRGNDCASSAGGRDNSSCILGSCVCMTSAMEHKVINS